MFTLGSPVFSLFHLFIYIKMHGTPVYRSFTELCRAFWTTDENVAREMEEGKKTLGQVLKAAYKNATGKTPKVSKAMVRKFNPETVNK